MLNPINHLSARVAQLGSAFNAEPLRSHIARQMPGWRDDSKGEHRGWGQGHASPTHAAAVSSGGSAGGPSMELMMPCFMSLSDPSLLMSGVTDFAALQPLLCSTDECRDFLIGSMDADSIPAGLDPHDALSCVCDEPAMIPLVMDVMDDGQLNNPGADQNFANLCSSQTCRPMMLSGIESSPDKPPELSSEDALDCACLSSSTVQQLMCTVDQAAEEGGVGMQQGGHPGGEFGPGAGGRPSQSQMPGPTQRPPGCDDVPVDGSFSPAALADFCAVDKCVAIVEEVGAEYGQSCVPPSPPFPVLRPSPPPSPSPSPPPPSPSPALVSSSPPPSGQSASSASSSPPPSRVSTDAAQSTDALQTGGDDHEGGSGGGSSAGGVVVALFIIISLGAAGGLYLHKTGRLRGQFALPVNLPKPRASVSSTTGAPPPNQQQGALPALAPPAGGGMWELNDAAREAAAQQQATGSASYQPPQPGAPV